MRQRLKSRNSFWIEWTQLTSDLQPKRGVPIVDNDDNRDPIDTHNCVSEDNMHARSAPC